MSVGCNSCDKHIDMCISCPIGKSKIKEYIRIPDSQKRLLIFFMLHHEETFSTLDITNNYPIHYSLYSLSSLVNKKLLTKTTKEDVVYYKLSTSGYALMISLDEEQSRNYLALINYITSLARDVSNIDLENHQRRIRRERNGRN